MKNLSTFTKGLIMAIVALIATTISTNGLPATTQGWEILGVTVVGTTLIYLGKNYVFPSVSIIGTIDLKDLLSGLVMAVGTGISNWLGTVVAGTVLNWPSLWTAVIGVVVGYLAKNLATQNSPSS